MKTLRYLLFATIILGCLTQCGKEDSGNGPRFGLRTSDSLDDIDYELYSLILDDLFTNAENLVVNQQTKAVFSDGAYLQYLEENYPEMDANVFLDYVVKNDTTCLLENKFNVPSKNVSLISTEEIEYIFSGTGDINKGWEEFYRRFPDSAGEISFTRIGYNADQTQAIVEMGNMYASLGGEGYLIFLRLENTEWKIAEVIPTWIS